MASPETPPASGGQNSPQKWSTGERIAILGFGGFLLALGGCGFFVVTCCGPGSVSALGAAVFVIGVMMVLVALVSGLVALARAIFKKRG
jgi:hypothetical protein